MHVHKYFKVNAQYAFLYVGKRRLKDLLRQSDNRVCADCDAPDPKWA